MTSVSTVRRSGQRGMSLVELIVAFTILSLLAGMAVPLARTRVRREREKELRLALREIHTAIDKYKDMADQGQLGQLNAAKEGYPESLEVLVEGVKVTGQAGGGLGTNVANMAQQGMSGQRTMGQSSTSQNSSSSSGSESGEKKIKFLRRIPRDPFTGKAEWGMRSTQDDPKSSAWGGQNVFSVYSKTMEKAADGTPYSEW